MKSYNFIFYLKAFPWQRSGLNKNTGRIFKQSKTRNAQNDVKLLCRQQMSNQKFRGLLVGPLEAEINIFFKKPKTVTREHPSVKPDVDNLAKTLLDAMNKIVYIDDAQVCRLLIVKKYSDMDYIVCKIKEME